MAKEETTKDAGSLSGLTEEEAKTFHKHFVTNFIIFTLIAVGAHVLAWMWQPWFPGGERSGSLLLETGQALAQTLLG